MLLILMVKTKILMAVLMIMLSSGFVIASYDRADDGIKIISSDEMDEEFPDTKIYYDDNGIINGVEDEVSLMSRYPSQQEIKINSYIPMTSSNG